MTDRSDLPSIDPALWRGVTQRRFARRDLFKAAGVGAGAVGLSAVLAACGVKSEKAVAPKAGGEGSPEWWAHLEQQGPAGQVNFTNWPQYIDIGHDAQGNRTRPTLDKFTEATGIDVTYRADINANEEFYAAIRPALQAGQDTGHDIIVITNGPELAEMMSLGYLIPLDHSLTPNFNANAADTVKDPSYDPGNKYTMAWQSGFDGIGWNTKYVKKPITSFFDLFDEAYKGKIGMWALNTDLPNTAMVALGINPETSTPDDWQKAADLLNKQKDSGVVRKYYTQDYLTAFENEDIWITQAWSGDILIDKLYYPEFSAFEFTIPKEGGVIWTDNMCIPAHAAHPLDAIMLMDWYYKPEIAAPLTEWNNYVSPVPAGEPIVNADEKKATGADKKILEAVASSPYVYPTPEISKNVYHYRVLKPDELEEWTALFEPIYIS